MYESLKRIAKIILPSSVLTKNERFFRGMISHRYRGTQYQCNVCNANLGDWVKLERGDYLCPSCGSLPRSRRLWGLINEENLDGKDILHFSPPKHLRELLSKIEKVNYVTTDYESEFESDETYDITDIPVDDDSFDVIICYHVLEHIMDDKKAISELVRVLREGGRLYVQTPFHDLPTDENVEYNTPELRLKYYGQKDHVRIYNANDLLNRFKLMDIKATLLTLESDEDNFHGFKKKESIILIEK